VSCVRPLVCVGVNALVSGCFGFDSLKVFCYVLLTFRYLRCPATVLPQPLDNNHRPRKLGLLVMIGLQATIRLELATVGSWVTIGEHRQGGRLEIFSQRLDECSQVVTIRC